MTLRHPPMPSLHALSLKEVAATGAHYGVSSDASTAIALIALSRLMRVKDAQILESVAASPLASAVLAALRASVLRVAAVAAGVGPGLSEANIATLFGLPGSSTKYQSQYGGSFGSLQSRLPWPRFRQVVTALLDALTSARLGPVGSTVGQMLLTSTPGAPWDAGAVQSAQSAIAALIAVLEPAMKARLASTAGASSAGSSSSEGSSHSTTPPPPPPMPAPQAPPGPPIALGIGIDPAASLASNLLRLVESRIRRSLSQSEVASVAAALDDGLSVLQSGGADARRQLLGASMLVALANQSGAWLWAAALEAIERPAASIAGIANAIVESCSTTAAMLFADAAADFETEAPAASNAMCITERRAARHNSRRSTRDGAVARSS